MKGKKIIINIIVDILIFILIIGVILAMYGFIQTKINKKLYSNYFGYTYFQILTGSMEDTINIDDIVFVKVTKDVKDDDIVSYISDNDIITHRIIETLDEGYITKGDNNNAPDGVIEKDKIIGKVVFIGKGYGKVLKMIKDPIFFIPLILTMVLFSWYFSIVKKERSA